MKETVHTMDLRFLDVVQSPAFVNGMRERNFRTDEDKPTLVGFDKPFTHDGAANDETRADAQFVVIAAGEGGQTEGFGGPDDNWWEVTAQRLHPDGSYNPDGEKITFRSNGYGTSIYAVERVGKMTLVAAS